VDFLVIIELFPLGVTTEALRAKINWGTGTRGRPYTNHSSRRKTGWIDTLYGI